MPRTMRCMDLTSVEQLLGEGRSLADIGRGLGVHEATVSYWAKKGGFAAANRERHAARGALSKSDLERLVKSGATIAEIAVASDRSKATVRHWLKRFGLRTLNGPGMRSSSEVRAAKEAGLVAARMRCRHHGEADFVLDGRGYYRCRKGRSAAVTRRRRKVKATLVREAGGCCCLCGYQGNMRALHFHHVDPADKRLELNARGIALSLATLRAEAQKCVLLCSNCHAEVEDGRTSIPVAELDGFSAARLNDPG
jgi:hypothetical protein